MVLSVSFFISRLGLFLRQCDKTKFKIFGCCDIFCLSFKTSSNVDQHRIHCKRPLQSGSVWEDVVPGGKKIAKNLKKLPKSNMYYNFFIQQATVSVDFQPLK